MDEIDKSILKLLKENSKLSNKEIGEKIFLTGQAVGNRISNMIDKGIIEKFTISISETCQETQFIRIFLKDTYFEKVENLINQFEDVQDFYKVRGQACYVVISHFSNDILNNFIESLSKYARYSVESVISNKKLS
ncbi:winged helix-turn-helix transcriptional regulator [Lactococcus lactis subsp. lactis]|uniref:Lrp/AsnC family transcriptional regulator n=1 Tax=Lactococcus lactis TaxID=1358 RepID=UPI00223A76F8|nr:winged helix-turn-helix transcriptional regulator [Lactococcus lactis]MCT0055568.1 winged helix-turn-helix transcriptional regulator [Lactococcus lactis subsp. lactis]